MPKETRVTATVVETPAGIRFDIQQTDLPVGVFTIATDMVATDQVIEKNGQLTGTTRFIARPAQAVRQGK
jgi:hypothetical protein